MNPEESMARLIQDIEDALDRVNSALICAHIYGFRTGCLSEARRQLEGALKFLKYGDTEISE